MQRKPDKLEDWWRGFWYVMWGVWAALTLAGFVFYHPKQGINVSFLPAACPLALAHLATFCFLRFRRWRAGRDD